MRQISSLEIREPAVRFMHGWRAALHAQNFVDCDEDRHWQAGYDEGKRVRDELRRVLAERYGVAFHVVRPAGEGGDA